MSPSIPLKARAAVIVAFDQDLVLRDDQPVLQPSELAPGQCLVKIDYAGVCHSDIHIKRGEWGPVGFPRVGGHEGIGHIVAIGEHTVNSPVKIGDRVGIKWLAKSCLNCEMCRTGFDACEPSQYFEIFISLHASGCNLRLSHGHKVDGSFADYALSYVDYCTPIPESLDSAAATPLLCAGLTVYKALKETNPQLGKWVAIPGAGGGLGHLGMHSIRYCNGHACDCDWLVSVILQFFVECSNDPDTGDAKRELCLQLGAEKWVDFKTSTNVIQDVKDAADGVGPHAAVVVSSSAGPLDQAVMYLRPKGTLVAVGIPSSATMLKVPVGLLVSKCLTIIGTSVGNRQDMAEALDIAASGKVACRHQVKPFSEINAIFTELAAENIAGRVVLKM
ncbi:Mannitol-1-phosphate dehydrogenase [Mycena sanguinolenta]|uniref:alcohol dehydrogenase n=1 Tax=Mycena sanguinolenta TaxID=230812 RepID=A0A8H6YHX1_9AGAR|nr:Mannitol-1-phosphate dehydrogenase [Mycena sanguinolenta]